jgi:hypothetical protein
MHALVAKHYGAEIVKMVLWPTDADDKLSFKFWADGHTWAYVQWKGGEYDDSGRWKISIAPQTANTIVLTLLLVLYAALDPSPIVTSLMAGWAVTQFVDGAVNLGTFYRPEPDNKRTDGWSFQDRSGLNKWVCRAGTATWHLTFGALLNIPW